MFPLMRRRPARTERAVARRTFEPFWNMHEEMERMFNRLAEEWRVPEEWVEMREWNVEEKDNEVVMRLEIPGFNANEFNLRVEGNMMVVRAEHPEKTEEKTERRHAERYEYRFEVPVGINLNGIEATYRNGVLELHLPRLPEAMPRRIEVKT